MGKRKSNAGRPTVMTPEVIGKLEEVFGLGGTDREACFFAGISQQALYDYQTLHPEFTERKEALKENPILKARRTIVESLEQPQHAQWYLSRKANKEFGDRTTLAGDKDNPLMPNEFSSEEKKELLSLLNDKRSTTKND